MNRSHRRRCIRQWLQRWLPLVITAYAAHPVAGLALLALVVFLEWDRPWRPA